MPHSPHAIMEVAMMLRLAMIMATGAFGLAVGILALALKRHLRREWGRQRSGVDQSGMNVPVVKHPAS